MCALIVENAPPPPEYHLSRITNRDSLAGMWEGKGRGGEGKDLHCLPSVHIPPSNAHFAGLR